MSPISFENSKENRICIRSPISLNRDQGEIQGVSKNEKGAFLFLETRILHHL